MFSFKDFFSIKNSETVDKKINILNEKIETLKMLFNQPLKQNFINYSESLQKDIAPLRELAGELDREVGDLYNKHENIVKQIRNLYKTLDAIKADIETIKNNNTLIKKSKCSKSSKDNLVDDPGSITSNATQKDVYHV